MVCKPSQGLRRLSHRSTKGGRRDTDAGALHTSPTGLNPTRSPTKANEAAKFCPVRNDAKGKDIALGIVTDVKLAEIIVNNDEELVVPTNFTARRMLCLQSSAQPCLSSNAAHPAWPRSVSTSFMFITLSFLLLKFEPPSPKPQRSAGGSARQSFPCGAMRRKRPNAPGMDARRWKTTGLLCRQPRAYEAAPIISTDSIDPVPSKWRSATRSPTSRVSLRRHHE